MPPYFGEQIRHFLVIKKANYLHCNRDVVANMSVNGVTIEDWVWLLEIFETKKSATRTDKFYEKWK